MSFKTKAEAQEAEHGGIMETMTGAAKAALGKVTG